MRIHFTMASPTDIKASKEKKKRKSKAIPTASPSNEQDDAKLTIPEHHPFFGWNKGDKLCDLHVVGVEEKDGIPFIDISNVKDAHLVSIKEASIGATLSGVVTSHAKNNSGLWIDVSPGVQGWICGLELSTDTNILNNMTQSYPIGSRINAVVIDNKKGKLFLSVVADKASSTKLMKPKRGDLVIGRIQRHKTLENGPALMLDLRGHFSARCCLTELCEMVRPHLNLYITFLDLTSSISLRMIGKIRH